MSTISDAIVEVVLKDLMNRRGIKQPFFEVEDEYPETFQEMKETLSEKIDVVLASQEVS